MTNPFDFSGHTILITGAANGIGSEIASMLSAQGARLILVDKDKAGLNELLNNLHTSNHSSYEFDVAHLEGIDSFLTKVLKEAGPLDGYVNCIGIRSRRPLNLLVPAIVSQVMAVNFSAFIEFVRVISRKGNFNKGMSIVSISSIAAQRGNAVVTAYAASKAAVDGAVRCLARELHSKKIRINTVAPSQIDTPEFKKLQSMNLQTDDPILSRQYMGLGKPYDVSNAVLFLLSSASGFITGSTLPVDGGFLTS